MNIRWLIMAGLLVASVGVLRAGDKEIKTARAILDVNQQALVEIRAVVKLSMESADLPLPNSNEAQHVMVSAVVIDPSGLAVASATLINPISAIPAISFEINGEKKSIAMKGVLSDIKMVMADGTEIPAKLVLEDHDLDLAFFMPMHGDTDKPAAFRCVTCSARAKPDLFDKIVVIDRLSETLNREATVGIHRINAIVEKPRTFFVSADLQNISVPVFNLKKEFIGFAVTRIGQKSSDLSEMISRMANAGGSIVILPVQDIMSTAQQIKKK